MHFQKVLPLLETLSEDRNVTVAELAVSIRTEILSKEAPQHSLNSCSTIAQHITLAIADLRSTMVPLRARGLVTLTKLIRKWHTWTQEEQEKHTINLFDLYMEHISDGDSYVFLAAVQGLAVCVEYAPDQCLPALLKTFELDEMEVEKKIKLSEALLFAAKRGGTGFAARYAKRLIYAYLTHIRPVTPTKVTTNPLIQEASSPLVPEECSSLPYGTFRASCLSNLAEICALLNYAIHPYVSDIITCVLGVLEQERDETQPSSLAVRRGAIYLISAIFTAFGASVLELLQHWISAVYRIVTVRY